MSNGKVYIVRRIDAAQLPALSALAQVVSGSAWSNEDRLAAKFATHAFGAEFVGYLAYPPSADGTIAPGTVPAAYYGVFPVAVRFGDHVVLAAQSGDTMTHPDHRGKGLFIDLAKRTYATAREEGVQFVFGFPNENSYPGFSRKLEWKFPYKMRAFNCLVPTIPVGFALRRLGRAPREFGAFARVLLGLFFERVEPTDALWDSSGSTAGVVRDARMWAYKKMGTLFVRRGDVGLALKFDGDLSIGEIVGNPTAAEMVAIMRRLSIVAILIGAVRIKSYFSPGSRLERALAPFGRCTESLWFGFVTFVGMQDPSTLELAYLDYDTF